MTYQRVCFAKLVTWLRTMAQEDLWTDALSDLHVARMSRSWLRAVALRTVSASGASSPLQQISEAKKFRMWQAKRW